MSAALLVALVVLAFFTVTGYIGLSLGVAVSDNFSLDESRLSRFIRLLPLYKIVHWLIKDPDDE